MIPSGLNELFGTLFVGLICLLTLALPLHVLVPGWRNQFYRILEWKNEGPRVLVFVLIVYGAGVLVNEVGNKATDTRRGPVWRILTASLPTEGELRLEALVHREASGAKLTGLGKEVCGDTPALWSYRHSALDHTPDFAQYVESVALKKQLCVEPYLGCSDRLADDSPVLISNALYYGAKNVVMRTPTLAPELAQIQRTIDWCRSAFLAGEIGLLLALFAFARVEYRRLANAGAASSPSPVPMTDIMADEVSSGHSVLAGALLGRSTLIGIVACWIGLLVMSRFGYEESSREFNQRAFGYHLTEIRERGIASAVRETTPVRPAEGAARPIESGITWMLVSEEYEILAESTFDSAAASLRRFVEKRNSSWSTSVKPLAVVLDVDDTVMRSVLLNKMLNEQGLVYTPELFVGLEHLHTAELNPVPGALKFIRLCIEQKIRVLLISNRRACEVPLVRSWLARQLSTSFSEDDILFSFRGDGDGEGKDARRNALAGQYEIALLVGDSLADFDDRFVAAKRRAAAPQLTPDDLKALNSIWFLLPNPVYGAWKR